MRALLTSRAPTTFRAVALPTRRDGRRSSRASGRQGVAAPIVGAGTGSGKTLAFYLPALTHVVSATSRPRDAGTGDLSANRTAARPVRRGVSRGPAPRRRRAPRSTDPAGRPLRRHTPPTQGGGPTVAGQGSSDRICPYMLCPACGEGALIWARQDIEAAVPRLRCEKCSTSVGPGLMSLTRDQMRAEPPDVLFTTTEMLNRTLMDGRMRHLVGVGRGGMPIDLVLLDEVHTYEGTTGAQVAGVLRRWRHARRKPVHFVGLSATLREAAGFFADLTGLQPQSVTSIEPRVTDLDQRGPGVHDRGPR